MPDSAVVELPVSRGPGAPKGRPKPVGSGRRPGVKNLATRQIRELAGKYSLRAVKQTWKLAQEAKDQTVQLKALELLLAYAHGKPSHTQLIGGAGGEPIRTEHRNSPIGSDRELARRLRLALDMGDKAQQEAQDAPTDGRTMNGTRTSVMPSDGPGESRNGVCKPAVGAAVDFDKARAITITRLTDDGREDHGGDFEVRAGDQLIRTLRGITFANAKDVVAAMVETGKIDG